MRIQDGISEVFSVETDKTGEEEEYLRMNNREEKMNAQQDFLMKGWNVMIEERRHILKSRRTFCQYFPVRSGLQPEYHPADQCRCQQEKKTGNEHENPQDTHGEAGIVDGSRIFKSKMA